MQVSLSKNSWHAQYYNWVKGYYPTYEFKSLCPYFWTIVSFVLLSPVFILWKGFKSLVKLTEKPIEKLIVSTVGKSVSEPYKEKKPTKIGKWYDKNEKKIGKFFGYAYFGIMMLALIIVLIGSFIQSIEKNGLFMTLVFTFAMIGALVTLFFVIWGLISIFETDTWRMIKGMSYSVKNRVCPMIEWKTNESTELS
jgi:hypothetical protein